MAESGLFGEYTQKFFKAKIVLVQSMFKDIIKIDDVKKDLFCYIPNLENSSKENKDFFGILKIQLHSKKILLRKKWI